MNEDISSGPAVAAFAGCTIRARSLPDFFLQLTARLAEGAEGLIFAHHNLHSLYLVQTDEQVRRFYQTSCECYIDGIGALWALRVAGVETAGMQRFSFMDCLPEFLTMAERASLRVFYLGGSPASVEQARHWLGESWPELAIGLHHGYESNSERVIERINTFAPDLLLVGLGMPLQEQWILEHRDALTAGIILQAGGTLDYYSGEQAQPPASWSRHGAAWLYRLLHDPGRLWRRYLLTPWFLLAPLLRLRLAVSKETPR
ncbi:MAG: glycosyltransferase [Haliea sp.]|nr:glycosyltransferase [Haliea sp.]